MVATMGVVAAVRACPRRQVRTNPACVVHMHRVLDRWDIFSLHRDRRHLHYGTVAASASGSRAFPSPAHGRDRRRVEVVNTYVVEDRRD